MQGAELKALRKRAGLTQAELAKVLHVSPAFVGEMERDEKDVAPARADLANERLGQWVQAMAFGDRFVVVVSRPLSKSQHGAIGRQGEVLDRTFNDGDEADAAARLYAEAHPEFRYHPAML